ncbi:MAG: 50S ribosomal protein L21 [Epsilonproteobacteria bacterium]|jgi:large subunit ribosomal protein L21|nr:50S ribosomal protein L21 [Campylobacterota bacterium]NPA88846.1 50S ribosomal protein L21 [Campylobacterota bacterium]
MYAVIKHGGKQYKVKEGDILELDRMEAEPKSLVEIEEVLIVADDNSIKVGKPVVEGAKVVLEVINHGRGKKVIIFKKRRRKDSKKKRGFRRDFTRVRVKEIQG